MKFLGGCLTNDDTFADPHKRAVYRGFAGNLGVSQRHVSEQRIALLLWSILMCLDARILDAPQCGHRLGTYE